MNWITQFAGRVADSVESAVRSRLMSLGSRATHESHQGVIDTMVEDAQYLEDQREQAYPATAALIGHQVETVNDATAQQLTNRGVDARDADEAVGSDGERAQTIPVRAHRRRKTG